MMAHVQCFIEINVLYVQLDWNWRVDLSLPSCCSYDGRLMTYCHRQQHLPLSTSNVNNHIMIIKTPLCILRDREKLNTTTCHRACARHTRTYSRKQKHCILKCKKLYKADFYLYSKWLPVVKHRENEIFFNKDCIVRFVMGSWRGVALSKFTPSTTEDFNSQYQSPASVTRHDR